MIQSFSCCTFTNDVYADLICMQTQHILCITREFDLSKQWNKFCKVSKFLREYSDTDVLVFGTLWLPWLVKGNMIHFDEGLIRLCLELGKPITLSFILMICRISISFD